MDVNEYFFEIIAHGTEEYINLRIEITKKLIEEKSFNFVAIEASFPDAYRLNRYVVGLSNDSLENCFNDLLISPNGCGETNQ
jgi:erythromycin esterase-like protein